MSKLMIAAALAASMLATTGASAASNQGRHHRVGVQVTGNAAQSYARELGSVPTSGGDWESRSVIYRGPTYIGRY